MKTLFPSLIFLLIGVTAFSQASFRQGYIIGRDSARIECQIRIAEWEHTPTTIEYRINDSSEVIMGSPSTVMEVVIEPGLRLISALVRLDISSDDEGNPSEIQEPDWMEQRIFLRTLITGKASLYEYDQTTMKRYFISTGEGPPEQLIYKLYRLGSDKMDVIRTNLTFRKQLFDNLKVEGMDGKEMESVEYNKSDLLRYVTKYNEQSGTPFTLYSRKKEAPGFNLRITPGMSYSIMRISNSYWSKQIFTYPGQVSFRMGVEAELVIPYTNRTVSLVFEPAYNHFSGTVSSFGQSLAVKLNYIEFPVGARYCFYLSKSSKIFVNLFYVPVAGINLNSDVTLDGYSIGYNFKRGVAAGVGFNWKRLSAEVRGYTNKIVKMESNYYYRFSLVLGFRLVGKKL